MISNMCFYDNFSTPLSVKALVLPLTFNQPPIKTQASLLGILIAFVDNFHLNLAVMFVCSVK